MREGGIARETNVSGLVLPFLAPITYISRLSTLLYLCFRKDYARTVALLHRIYTCM